MLQEAVNIERTLHIHAIDHTERVERHLVPVQHVSSGDDFVERGFAVFGNAVAVVQFFRSVDAKANQEIVLLEESSPVIVKQRAVGLEIVSDTLVRLLVLLFEPDDLLEELQSQQSGFAALPRKHDLVAVLSFDVLLDVGFEDIV